MVSIADDKSLSFFDVHQIDQQFSAIIVMMMMRINISTSSRPRISKNCLKQKYTKIEFPVQKNKIHPRCLIADTEKIELAC